MFPTWFKIAFGANVVAVVAVSIAALVIDIPPEGLFGRNGRQEAKSFAALDVTGANYGRDFRLADPDGRWRSLADFRGRAVLLFFGFTQCPDVCPTALARAAEVRRLLGDDAGRLQVIFVTLDPERDSPDMLRAYTAAFDPGFLGLRTDPDGTRQVAEDFKVFYRKVPTGGSYTLDHSALSYVFDTGGRLRLAVPHDLPADKVAADLRVLLASAAHSE